MAPTFLNRQVAASFGGPEHGHFVELAGSEDLLAQVHPIAMQAIIDHAPVKPEDRMQIAEDAVVATLHVDRRRIHAVVEYALAMGS